MKKIFIFAVIFLACVIFVLGSVDGQNAQRDDLSEKVLRIHIRANSNDEEDQRVKYAVKSAVVEYVTPLLVGVKSKSDAQRVIESRLTQIANLATTVLAEDGFDYSATARLTEETFPTRKYQRLTLPSGNYDALVVDLGNASGDNWWCVVYPPLCFVGGSNDGANGLVYRSKLMEIIEKFFKDGN